MKNYGDIREVTFINDSGYFETRIDFTPDRTGKTIKVKDKTLLKYGRCKHICDCSMIYRGKLKS